MSTENEMAEWFEQVLVGPSWLEPARVKAMRISSSEDPELMQLVALITLVRKLPSYQTSELDFNNLRATLKRQLHS